MNQLLTGILISVTLGSCSPRKVPSATVETMATLDLKDVAMTHFRFRGDSPGHLRILWKGREWGTYREGCVLSRNPTDATFEAGIVVITTTIQGKTAVTIGFGSSPASASSGKTVMIEASDKPPTAFYRPRMKGPYDTDLTIGMLGGHELIASLDTQFFDYIGLERVPRDPNSPAKNGLGANANTAAHKAEKTTEPQTL